VKARGVNILGIVSAILMFVSLILPWWTLTVEGGYGAGTTSFFLIGPSPSLPANSAIFAIWLALGLVVVSGISSLVGSVKVGARSALLWGGILAALSVVIFAIGLQVFISGVFLRVSLFYSGPFDGGYTASAYLSFGFWLALVAVIMAIAAYRRSPHSGTPDP